jgi:SecD/SecF fusion protein
LEFTTQLIAGKTSTVADAGTIRDIFLRRIQASGVGDAIVTVIGADRVGVDLPDSPNEGSIERLLGSTGRLDFVPLPPARYGTNATNPDGPTGVVVGQPLPSDEIVLFSNDQIGTVDGTTDTNGIRAVTFSLGPVGTKLLDDWSAHNVGDYFALVLDGVVVYSLYIMEPLTGGRGAISGRFTDQEVNDLVTILRSGSLPFPVTISERSVVGP